MKSLYLLGVVLQSMVCSEKKTLFIETVLNLILNGCCLMFYLLFNVYIPLFLSFFFSFYLPFSISNWISISYLDWSWPFLMIICYLVSIQKEFFFEKNLNIFKLSKCIERWIFRTVVQCSSSTQKKKYIYIMYVVRQTVRNKSISDTAYTVH